MMKQRNKYGLIVIFLLCVVFVLSHAKIVLNRKPALGEGDRIIFYHKNLGELGKYLRIRIQQDSVQAAIIRVSLLNLSDEDLRIRKFEPGPGSDIYIKDQYDGPAYGNSPPGSYLARDLLVLKPGQEWSVKLNYLLPDDTKYIYAVYDIYEDDDECSVTGRIVSNVIQPRIVPYE